MRRYIKNIVIIIIIDWNGLKSINHSAQTSEFACQGSVQIHNVYTCSEYSGSKDNELIES